MDLGLNNKKVLITGASQGTGEGLAVAFAREGSDLKLVARDESRLAALADSIRERFNVSEMFDYDSIAGTTGNAALMAFTRALGGRSLNEGIRVLGVHPGPVDTDRIRKVLKAQSEEASDPGANYVEKLKHFPLGRPGTVDEVADLFVFLASAKSSYTSGAVITLDGGLASNRSTSGGR